jgi:hypothetical protein
MQDRSLLIIAAAAVLVAIILGGVMLKVSHDNRCKPVRVGGGEAGVAGVYGPGGWEKPPGC